MATKKTSVYYRDPFLTDDDGAVLTHQVDVLDGDVGGLITVDLDGSNVQVLPYDAPRQFNSAFYVADKKDLPA